MATFPVPTAFSLASLSEVETVSRLDSDAHLVDEEQYSLLFHPANPLSSYTGSEISPLAPPNQATPLRRRRTFPRAPPFHPSSSTTHGRSTSATISLDPSASEFTPAARMPPKRKASSSARSGYLPLSAPRSGSPYSDESDLPIIQASDIFDSDFSIPKPATKPKPTPSDPSYDPWLDDEIEIEVPVQRHSRAMPAADSTHQQRQAARQAQEQLRLQAATDRADGYGQRMQESVSWLLNSSREKNKTEEDPFPSSSAILYSANADLSDSVDGSARVSYLPLCPATLPPRWAWKGAIGIGRDSTLTILPEHRERIDTSSAGSDSHPITAIWPAGKVPVEIFVLITEHLPRDSVKAMRMVNKEFEEKVCLALFNTSVVPFNTELYDMIEEDAKSVGRVSVPLQQTKGKGRAVDHGGLHWQNAKEDAEGKVYKGHGLRVFQGFGPHIRRFGMSFDVLEGQLSHPPVKRELDHVQSYFGSYDWPLERYTRFAGLAGLEQTADETSRMKSAFANLHKVSELALSVDSGLGWLNGPDKSIHARIFQRQDSIFGPSWAVADRQTQEANTFWDAVQTIYRSADVAGSPKEVALARRSLPLGVHPSEIPGIRGTQYADARLWSSISASKSTQVVASHSASDSTGFGVLYTTFSNLDSAGHYDKSALVPADLRKEQKEWLLETEWAQRAFLECYMLAVIDNASRFSMVNKLKIAKLSSGFLPLLARESFWDALPNLTDVTILVKPDWRTVEKDEAGLAETCPQNPSEAIGIFHQCILQDRLCLRSGITKLNIGWASGGEHADGIFARNNHILPAPLTRPEDSTAANTSSGLVFRHVEHLTLTNCWVTPTVLQELVARHADKVLKTLTLDSVSLTAHPRNNAGILQNQQLAQAIAAMQQAVQPHAPVNPLAVAAPPVPQVPALTQVGSFPHAAPQSQAHQQFGLFQNPAPAPQNPLQAQVVPNQLQLQHGLFAMQAQQQAQGHFHHQIPHNPVQPNPQAAAPPQHWTASHREGSWAQLLDILSPGPTLSSYLPAPPAWEQQPAPRPITPLQSITLISCGYVLLSHPMTPFDQYEIAGEHQRQLSVWFRTRQSALSSAMLVSSNDRFLGKIVQGMSRRELNALSFAWGLREGWDDEAKAEEVEYDGLLKGGTGRISGTVFRGMELVGEREVVQTA